MNRRLNLVKDKLPKRSRRRTDDEDDELFILGMYNNYLNTEGYDVDTTANKKIQADFPEIEGVEWLHDSQVKDYQSLMKNRRNKMTQTFRYMLRQNETPYSSVPLSEKQDDDDESDDHKPSPEKQLLDDIVTVAKMGGKALYHTGRAVGQIIKTGIDTYNWLNEEDEDGEPEPPIDEGVFTQTQGLMRRGASRAHSQSSRGSGERRSRSPEERASGSNDAIRLLQRGASRSRSSTPDKKPRKK